VPCPYNVLLRSMHSKKIKLVLEIDLRMLRTEDLPKSYDLKFTNVGRLALNWELSIKDDWISTDRTHYHI